MATRDYRTPTANVYGAIDPTTGLPYQQTQGRAPYTMPAPSYADGMMDDPLAQYERRNEGAGGFGRGAMSGAATGATLGSFVPALGTAAGAVIGGIGGGIAGAFTKNAKSAMTDFSAGDARDAIGGAYRQHLGREASPSEIDSQLRGQGFRYDQGHQWVGETGLRAVLDSIQNSDEAARRVGGASNAGVTAPPNPGFAANPVAGRPAVPGQPATQPANATGFTGGSGGLVDPYTLPGENDLLSLLSNPERYGGYDASTGRTGMAGKATGAGGYAYGGFDFAQDAGNRDIGKSAKYAFSQFAEQAGAQGVPQPRTKAEAEAWFSQHIAPGLQAAGYEIEWVQGDKARIRTREGWDEIDFLINADGENPTLGWQSEVLAPGGPMATGGGMQGGGRSLPTSGMDLTSSDLFAALMAQAQAMANGQATGANAADTQALITLLLGGR
jgi:hypothetical protein